RGRIEINAPPPPQKMPSTSIILRFIPNPFIPSCQNLSNRIENTIPEWIWALQIPQLHNHRLCLVSTQLNNGDYLVELHSEARCHTHSSSLIQPAVRG
ncbi:hypothetical protein AVEN_176275-1, partial [Araneus ventricosus]